MLAASELRQLLQRGNYSEAIRRHSQVQELVNIVMEEIEKRKRSFLGSKRNWEWTPDCLDAAALLAELYDQTSQYKSAASILTIDPDAAKTLENLERRSRTPGQDAKEKGSSSEARKMYRASVMFCMAHAIALHRLYLKRPEALSQAIQIADSVLTCLRTLERADYHLCGAHSFASYWLGRFHMLRYDFEKAEEQFIEAMAHQQANVTYHLKRHLLREQGHSTGSARDCESCQSTVFLSSYHIASNMAFGLATIRLQSGKIAEALTILRPALVLLEGSTDDRYRQGYVRLLMGTAMRIQAGMRVDSQQQAEVQLLNAVTFFEETKISAASHAYYAARAYYQLSLTQLFIARSGQASAFGRFEALGKLASYLSRTHFHHKQCEDQYADLELRVGLPVLRARATAEILSLLSQCTQGDCAKAIHELVRDQKIGAISTRLGLIKAGNIPPLIELQRDLAKEASENILEAKKLCGLTSDLHNQEADTKHLFEGTDSPRTRYEVVLADADVAATVYESIVAGKEDDPEGILRETRDGAQQKASEAFIRVNKLTGPQVPFEKLRGSAHVLAARLLLLRNDVAGARRHLISGWEPLSRGIENRVVNDAAQEIIRKITPEGYVLLATRSDGRSLTMDEMSHALHSKLIQEGLSSGRSLEETGIALGRGARTLSKWKKGDEQGPRKRGKKRKTA